ncbi:hypothetical protein CH367_18055 [Leptospira barantonii]|uniref:Lipoprotein n=2 Tax=Leptospira barantonii TaxID=2023184 RepID=A0ABX4NG40_9LEPT|nr:hypothetical protein CH367_18055 [Leptospira barantonii]
MKLYVIQCFSLIILLFANCISMRIIDPTKKMANGIPEERMTLTLFGVRANDPNMICEGGLQEVQFERPFWAAWIMEIYGILPLFVNVRKSVSICAESGTSSSLDSANFNDIISLKNGEIITGVKTAVTGDSVVVTTKDGKVSVYRKREVSGIKKN